eukprot:1369215-Pyramimonas_sp.AAC.1
MKNLELLGVASLNNFHSVEPLFDLRCHRRACRLHSGGQPLETGIESGRRVRDLLEELRTQGFDGVLEVGGMDDLEVCIPSGLTAGATL